MFRGFRNVVGFGLTIAVLVTLVGGPIRAQEKITFWYPVTSESVTKAWHQIAEDFHQAHPDIQVNVQFPTHGSEYGEKIFMNLAAGTAPDILRLPTRDRLKMQFSGQKVIMLLDELSPNFEEELGLSDVLPMLHEYHTVNGRWIGFPLWVLAHGLAYNRDLFRQSGLNAYRAPGTWEEVVEFGKKLTRDADGDGKIDTWGFAPPVGESPYTAIRWHAYMYSRGLEAFNEDYTKCLYNQPEAVEILQLWVDMYRKYKIVNPNIDVSALGKTYTYFNEGRAGIALGYVTVGATPKAFDWYAGVYPGFEGVRPSTRMDAHTLSIFEQSEHKEAAYEFMKFIAQTDNYAKVISEMWFLPSKISVLDHPLWIEHVEKAPFLRVFERILLGYKLHEQPMIPVASDVRPVVAEVLQKAVRGMVTPKEALDDAAERVDRILKEAREKGRWLKPVW